MTKAELVHELDQLNVDPRSYSFDELFVSEQYVLVPSQGGIWHVYYAQRGERSGLREFASESEAYSYFLGLLTRDKTTRLKIGYN